MLDCLRLHCHDDGHDGSNWPQRQQRQLLHLQPRQQQQLYQSAGDAAAHQLKPTLLSQMILGETTLVDLEGWVAY